MANTSITRYASATMAPGPTAGSPNAEQTCAASFCPLQRSPGPSVEQFGKFGDVLARVGKQLDTARKTIDDTGRRTRAMERKLRDVQELPADAAEALLGLPVPDPEDPIDRDEEATL